MRRKVAQSSVPVLLDLIGMAEASLNCRHMRKERSESYESTIPRGRTGEHIREGKYKSHEVIDKANAARCIGGRYGILVRARAGMANGGVRCVVH